ncbi:MAG: hypothetical protein COV96_02045 [Candidatus Zambryskibacteria bacterium CG11_big_fil_rev_8_21_14_0_20_42_18]|nr:MAG: hypothetical protein COV96_02045 [Candidatus Zambryskibacteria bacterium CG11_big_fil_rev_8_21_14_0_20_42_18]
MKILTAFVKILSSILRRGGFFILIILIINELLLLVSLYRGTTQLGWSSGLMGISLLVAIIFMINWLKNIRSVNAQIEKDGGDFKYENYR